MKSRNKGAPLNFEAVRKLRGGALSEHLDRLKNEVVPYLHSLDGPGFLGRPCQQSADDIEIAVRLADLIKQGDVKSCSEIQPSGDEHLSNSRRPIPKRPEDE
jgi:hypothetical protein